ncbi:MAG: anthranilate synthase component I family protein [Flavobacteriales bacterium]|nr:anthranilate synthase component I family protein [Flavobacteriales bacterium]
MILRSISPQLHLHSNGHGPDIHAFGAVDLLEVHDPIGAWDSAREFIRKNEGKFICAAFSYELKDDLEALGSNNPCAIPFPSLFLFVPDIVFSWELGELKVLQLNRRELDVEGLKQELFTLYNSPPVETIKAYFTSIDRSRYISQVESLKAHIQRGDIYEVNYCQELTIDSQNIDPWVTFQRLNSMTRAPFACHLRVEDLHLLCASPELFLEKSGATVRSRPIKGTRKRDLDPREDERLKKELASDIKERAENIMITDLVRNDLSRTARSQSVEVEELCEVYSFETVHQMISTVRSELAEEHDLIDLLKSCFPMGSMTGAPKIRAMELIEEHEDFRRGIYSGSVGVITPQRDMTLNVVIRSILYDDAQKKASVAAGGAITALSEPEQEYEESILKARAMMAVLGIDL